MSLKQHLQQKIKAEGPISVTDFMTLALSHTTHGYYMKQDPFGAQGDFITAPEISQMFGEMIGAWIADTWMQMGAPTHFTLLECGPGRGTLMADILRATKKVKGFRKACHITLMEISPTLREKQKQTLKNNTPQWISSLDEVPRDQPLILIANEFLDALPIVQYVGGQRQERKIDYNAERHFHFTFPPDNVVETSPACRAFIKELSVLLKHLGGAGLFIDYGYERGTGDTLQAVYKHKYCDVLEHIGDADITAHVDFGSLKHIIPSRLTTQGHFLKSLGILHRADILSQKAPSPQTQQDIQNALHRLTHSDEMGTLFKVMGVTHDRTLNLAGF